MQISLSEHFTYKKLFRFVLPCVTMMLVTSLYTVTDGFFVSNFVGKNAFAALNLIWPFLTIIGAAGFMIGAGGSALISYTLGMGDEKKANEIFTMLVAVLTVVGVAVSAVSFVFMRPISVFLGAGASTLEDCVLYGRILLCANPLFMLQVAFQSFLVTAEKPKLGLWISVFSGATNFIFDFLLVYVFSLGVWGAALATAFSQAVGGVIPIVYFFCKNSSRLRFVKTKLHVSALWKAAANGSSEMLSNISGSIVNLIYNYQLLRLVAENGVAAYGAIMYVAFVFAALFIGYAMGCTPIIGYHYGAGNSRELKSLLQKSLLLTTAASIIMFVLAELLAAPLAKLYVGYDPHLYAMTVQGMRLFSLSFLLVGFNIFGSAFFTGLNNGKVSALISFLRTLVIQVITILALPLIWGLNGIWLATVVAEALTFIVTLSLLFVNRKKYHY
ncbi:MAG: MATE family efflux transporter [Oscillospiraceae bacterium]|nr:MATE family efflux transporter [Oscillospiraceae bacterium]